MVNKTLLLLFLFALILFFTTTPSISAQTTADWYMAGANPQRTSWVTSEVRGNLNVAWYHPIEPYINYKIQPIATNGKIYVSTARGLYAFNATNGNLDWVYGTQMPLGHSPTVVTINNKIIVFAPGYDRKIHALDANSGQPLWTTKDTDVGAGFETNPLVINDSYVANTIFAGNRDGSIYAFDATNGNLKWKYQTGGPITASAAYKNGKVYVASNDMFVYALDAANGSLIWKSSQLMGEAFFSYWPVIYTDKSTGKDYIVVNGGSNYRSSELWVPTSEDPAGEASIFNSYGLSGGRLPRTSSPVPGDWASGTVTMDANIINDYLSKRPYRRTTSFLDAATGQEYSYTVNGKTTYPPFSYSGVTRGGSKYPAIVNGIDGVLYHQTAYTDFGGWITRGAPVGWKFGTQYLSEVANTTYASDEPTAYSSGGNIIYFSLCCDRGAVGFDVRSGQGSWTYWNYNMANNSLIPGYQEMYNDGDSSTYNNMNGWQIYVGKNKSHNGIYGKHGQNQSPAIPYNGKLYFLRGNSLIAFSATGTNPKTPMPLATIVTPTTSGPSPLTTTDLTQRLETQVKNIIAAGPLRPGYFPAGFFEININQNGDDFGEIFDYFQNPADTVYTLLLAYPYLSSVTQNDVKNYLNNYYGPGKTYDFTKFVHVGWGGGAGREWGKMPDDWLSLSKSPGKPGYAPLNPSTSPICPGCGNRPGFPPFNFYAGYLWAKIFGGTSATTILNAMSSSGHAKPEAPLSNSYFIKKPYFLNQYIAGYYGYLQLLSLAGRADDATIRNYYNNLLSLRTNNFLTTYKNTPYWFTGGQDGTNWILNLQQSLAVARNFMFLTPELGESMSKIIATSDMQTILDEYTYVAPYWFVSRFDSSYGEATNAFLYNSPALLQAKAYILKQPLSEISKYIDAPAFKVGDLFYIQNLVAALQAASSGPSPTPDPCPKRGQGDVNCDQLINTSDLVLVLTNFNSSNLNYDINKDSRINIFDAGIIFANFGK